jgi:hypothetical protein
MCSTGVPGGGHDGRVEGWQKRFLDACDQVPGAAIGDGAFRPGPAVWVGRREVAHLDDDDTVDIRLTRAAIKARRAELVEDERVALRAGSSDWLRFEIREHRDLDDALALVRQAVEANLPTAPPGLPPTGAELARRIFGS